VAQAREEGVDVTPKQLFECQTVARLAEVSGSLQRVESEQGVVSGPVPLAPIQSAFFQWGLVKPQHYNQSMLLEVKPGVDSEVLETVVTELLRHHDGLRMRYSARAGREWQQSCEEEIPGGVYERRD